MESHKELMRSYLCESLRELAVKAVFEKITIKQICDRAGVIRATFYNYFDDKYDCLSNIVALDMSHLPEDGDAREMIRKVLSNIEENRSFYQAAYNVKGQNSFDDMVHSNLADLLRNYLREHRKEGTMEQYPDDLLARYFAECIAFDVHEFVFRKDDSIGVDEMTDQVIDLMRTSIVDLLA